MTQKLLFLVTGLCLSVLVATRPIQAQTILGTGTDALLGGDLTDPEDDGDPENDQGYNATFDANDDGVLNLTDPVRLLRYRFVGGAPLPPPFPDPGIDPTEDDLSCERRGP